MSSVESTFGVCFYSGRDERIEAREQLGAIRAFLPQLQQALLAVPMLPALLRLARLRPGAGAGRVRFAIAGLAFRATPIQSSSKAAAKAIIGSWMSPDMAAATIQARVRGRRTRRAASPGGGASPTSRRLRGLMRVVQTAGGAGARPRPASATSDE